jgi:hypothetical protein
LKVKRPKPAEVALAPSGDDVLPILKLIVKCGPASCTVHQLDDLLWAFLGTKKFGIELTEQQVADRLKKV